LSCRIAIVEWTYLQPRAAEGVCFLIHMPPNCVGLRRHSRVATRGNSANMKIVAVTSAAAKSIHLSALPEFPSGLFQLRPTRIRSTDTSHDPSSFKCRFLPHISDDTFVSSRVYNGELPGSRKSRLNSHRHGVRPLHRHNRLRSRKMGRRGTRHSHRKTQRHSPGQIIFHM
jgi:hypothetical protein